MVKKFLTTICLIASLGMNYLLTALEVIQKASASTQQLPRTSKQRTLSDTRMTKSVDYDEFFDPLSMEDIIEGSKNKNTATPDISEKHFGIIRKDISEEQFYENGNIKARKRQLTQLQCRCP
jgi:hypothetical protein